MSEEARVLGAVFDYPSMMAVMRARANELHIARSDEHTGELAGLPDKYLAKLLGPRPVRRIGMKTMGAVMGVLQMKFIAVVDEEAVRRLEMMAKRYGKQLKTRDDRRVHSQMVTIEFSRRHMQKIGRRGGQARFKIDAKIITKLARAAGKARQAKRRLARKEISWNAIKGAVNESKNEVGGRGKSKASPVTKRARIGVLAGPRLLGSSVEGSKVPTVHPRHREPVRLSPGQTLGPKLG